MKVEFFNKKNGSVYLSETTDWCYFIMNNEVYCDNQRSYESQSNVVVFEDFIERCPHVGWRIVEDGISEDVL